VVSLIGRDAILKAAMEAGCDEAERLGYGSQLGYVEAASIGEKAATVALQQLEGAVTDRDRWRDCARKLYAQWQAGERPPSESALGRIGFQMREPEREQS
jgi:hypothetical protein